MPRSLRFPWKHLERALELLGLALVACLPGGDSIVMLSAQGSTSRGVERPGGCSTETPCFGGLWSSAATDLDLELAATSAGSRRLQANRAGSPERTQKGHFDEEHQFDSGELGLR